MTRRRFLAISASAALVPGVSVAATPMTQWRGVALGAEASITLRHPEAERLIAAARAEIERLEEIFSLYRTSSALSRLNAAGHLGEAPFEMLELLGLCGTIHVATQGLFDPTVQPLWAAYARCYASGVAPDAAGIKAALDQTGWADVTLAADRVTLGRPGMALTLNGIAQGYIADRVAGLLGAEGLTNVLINTGEFRALGGHPDGGGWPVSLDDGVRLHEGLVDLRDMALASSAPLGTVFDAAGTVGHILHPVTGLPAAPSWRLITVAAPKAALADGLTTAMCLMTREEIARTLERLPTARLVYLG